MLLRIIGKDGKLKTIHDKFLASRMTITPVKHWSFRCLVTGNIYHTLDGRVRNSTDFSDGRYLFYHRSHSDINNSVLEDAMLRREARWQE